MNNVIRITSNDAFADIVYKLTVAGVAFTALHLGGEEWTITITGY